MATQTSLGCCPQVSSLHCWAAFSAYLGWGPPWRSAEQITGSDSEPVSGTGDCTPVTASSNLPGTGKAPKYRAGAAWKITRELLAASSSINIWCLFSRVSALLLKINVLAQVVIHLKNILSLLHPSFLLSQCSKRKTLPFLFHLLRMHSSAATLTGCPSKPQHISLYILRACFSVFLNLWHHSPFLKI